MEPTDSLLAELLAVAREQLRWQQVTAFPAVRATVEALLSTAQMRQVYELCDGTRSFREVAAQGGVALGTVARWTRRWKNAGLAYEDASGRVCHLIGLDTLGLSPETAETSTERARTSRG